MDHCRDCGYQLVVELTSQWTVVVLRAAAAGHKARRAVVAHKARDAAAHHLASLAVANSAGVCGVHQLLSVAIHPTFLLAF